MTSQKTRGQNLSLTFATPTSYPSAACPESEVLISGLRLLEYLATSVKPATQAMLCAALNMTDTTLLRSLEVLKQRGYIVLTDDGSAYEATHKLYPLPSNDPPHQRLLEAARPAMQNLADTCAQTCNLAIPAYPDLQVIFQAHSSGPFGINMPLGFRYNVQTSAPGLVFAAFMKNFDAARWSHLT
ncbi:MAG: helix-turn-helix domain-containing protein, partial [Asticcacaulis sp.]